jgi:hypothetical protein
MVFSIPEGSERVIEVRIFSRAPIPHTGRYVYSLSPPESRV